MNNYRKRRGRPKLYDSVMPVDLSECLFCFHVYNRSAITLQQTLVQDTNYCVRCWMTEIMEKVYEDPLDVQIKKFWEGKIYYRELINN